MNVQSDYEAPTLTAVGSLAELTLQGGAVGSVLGSLVGTVAGNVDNVLGGAADSATGVADIGVSDQTVGQTVTGNDSGTLFVGVNDQTIGGLFN
jgi:hypothetical protein